MTVDHLRTDTRHLPPPPYGQYNLFTGELERLPASDGEASESGWLFDPDFGLVLPEDRAGKEILVEEGIRLSFPAQGLERQVTGNRLHRTGEAIENLESKIDGPQRAAGR